MPCVQIDNGIMCVGGPVHHIVVNGEDFYFEILHCGGLAVCSPDGDEHKEPPAKHPFWMAIDWWCQQGHKEENGLCVYDPDEEVVEILEHLGGKHFRVIGYETVGQRKKRLRRDSEAIREQKGE